MKKSYLFLIILEDEDLRIQDPTSSVGLEWHDSMTEHKMSYEHVWERDKTKGKLTLILGTYSHHN